MKEDFKKKLCISVIMLLMMILFILFFWILLNTPLEISDEEKAFNKRYFEIKTLKLNLSYYKDLYRLKEDILFEEKFKKIDSLINNFEK